MGFLSGLRNFIGGDRFQNGLVMAQAALAGDHDAMARLRAAQQTAGARRAAEKEHFLQIPKPADLGSRDFAGSKGGGEIRPRYQWGPPAGARPSAGMAGAANWVTRQPPARSARPGPGEVGHSYLDPVYDQVEAPLEDKYGLPRGLLGAIRTRGERSNADRVSSDGAETVYQIIPSTRAGIRRNYGVDAYEGIKEAAHAAARVLAESYERTGDWNLTIGEYHGGPNRDRWGPVNEDYRRRVGDFSAGKGAPLPAPRRR